MSVTTEQLQTAIKEMYELRSDYDAKKKISNEADALHKEKKAEVLKLLLEGEMDSFAAKGVGKVSVSNKLRVVTPKTTDDKALLFKWLKDNMGADGFLSYASVNSASLNKLYNMCYDESEDKSNFKIDGVGNPVLFQDIRFNKE